MYQQRDTAGGLVVWRFTCICLEGFWAQIGHYLTHEHCIINTVLNTFSLSYNKVTTNVNKTSFIINSNDKIIHNFTVDKSLSVHVTLPTFSKLLRCIMRLSLRCWCAVKTLNAYICRGSGVILGNYYGSGSRPISHQRQLQCIGNERSIAECQDYSSSGYRCVHDDDVSIACDDGIGECADTMMGQLTDVITCAKYQDDIFRGYDFTGGRISHFPIDLCMGLTTVQ